MNELIEKEQKTDISKSKSFIEAIAKSIAPVLGRICTRDRFLRVVLSCIRKDDKLIKLLETKEGRRDLARVFMECAELNIEPDGRRAYVIAYGREVKLIIGYQGKIELIMRTGLISNVHSDKVCENDEFVYNMGVIEKHCINFKENRGNPYAFYSIITFKDGTKKCEVMSKEEVDKIRLRSKTPYQGPWVSDYDEMAKKTVFLRAVKWVPLSPEVQESLFKSEDEYLYKNTTESFFKANDENPEEVYQAVEDENVIDVKN